MTAEPMVSLSLPLLVLAAATSHVHQAAVDTAHIASRDPNWVSNAVEQVDVECTQHKCAGAVSACVSAGQTCAERVDCAENEAKSPAECWAGVRWSDLHPHELKMWNCATSKGCLPKGTSYSLLELATDLAGPDAKFEDDSALLQEDAKVSENQMRTHTSSAAEAKEQERRRKLKAELTAKFDKVGAKMKAHLAALIEQEDIMHAARNKVTELRARMKDVAENEHDPTQRYKKLSLLQEGLGAVSRTMKKHFPGGLAAHPLPENPKFPPPLPKEVEEWVAKQKAKVDK